MSVAIVTGSGGLVGAAVVRRLAAMGFEIAGIDNDLRSYFFGIDASTRRTSDRLAAELASFRPHPVDIRDADAVNAVFSRYGRAVSLVIHAASQPSHDWAAREPLTDFGVNATGTLHVLEAARRNCPDAVFIFTSTNKVYGDRPNALPFVELSTRWELDPEHAFHARGIDESMSIDGCLHSLFGASKAAADLLVQEYGRYFGMRTGVFRAGCLTGPHHAGAELHGFLAHLCRCATTGREYRVIGHKGKQVRDNLHCDDLADAFIEFFAAPRAAAVYNIGGGRENSCSVREAIRLCEAMTGRPMRTVAVPEARIGDHIWWITDTRRFETDYPGWRRTHSLAETLAELIDASASR